LKSVEHDESDRFAGFCGNGLVSSFTSMKKSSPLGLSAVMVCALKKLLGEEADRDGQDASTNIYIAGLIPSSSRTLRPPKVSGLRLQDVLRMTSAMSNSDHGRKVVF
jgi:hypothetical protein